MIRAEAIDKETVHVEITSVDFRVIQQEADRLKAVIPPRDRYWDPKLKVWVISNAQAYLHIHYIDFALRKIMQQMELV